MKYAGRQLLVDESINQLPDDARAARSPLSKLPAVESVDLFEERTWEALGPGQQRLVDVGLQNLHQRVFGDSVFTAVLKVYTTTSARRSMSDLREAHERGYINALENAELTPILLADHREQRAAQGR